MSEDMDTKTKMVKKLSEADLSLTESMQIFYTACPQVGTKREDLLKPIFWAHVAKKLRPMSEIRVMPKDGAWYGVYLVVYSDQVQAKVKELAFHQLSSDVEEAEPNDPYTIKWISPPVKFGVIRNADKTVVKDGFKTKEEAVLWKNNNLRQVAA